MDSFSINTHILCFDSLLQSYPLCDHCIGRLAAKVGHGLTNEKRGKVIRDKLTVKEKTPAKDCWLCEGLISEINHFVSLIHNKLSEYEFDSFLIGTRIDEDIEEREQTLQKMVDPDIAESIKNDLNRNIGRILEKKWGKTVDFHHPDIMVIVDTQFDVISLQIKSLYIYGRYNKFQRGIPQTKWFCRKCKGKGCRNCKYTGKLYEESIEELIAAPIVSLTKASDESFHGSGREDIDVRMLGNGRPFILEIKNPMVRTIDLSLIREHINAANQGKIAVNHLRFTKKKNIARIKESHFPKIYRVKLKGVQPFRKEKLKKVALSLGGTIIQQYTPTRVARRRAHKIRKRQIYSCTVEDIDNSEATLRIEAEAGTYIKELVTGDNERTKPNISSLLDMPCTVASLDVIEIKGDE